MSPRAVRQKERTQRRLAQREAASVHRIGIGANQAQNALLDDDYYDDEQDEEDEESEEHERQHRVRVKGNGSVLWWIVLYCSFIVVCCVLYCLC